LGKAYRCDACGRYAPSTPEETAEWIGVQTFRVPAEGDNFLELEFCCAFDAAAYFFRGSKIGPFELQRLLPVVSQAFSPGPVTRLAFEEVKAELLRLQQMVAAWEEQGMVETRPEGAPPDRLEP